MWKGDRKKKGEGIRKVRRRVRGMKGEEMRNGEGMKKGEGMRKGEGMKKGEMRNG